jgi:type I restriction enzyme M protein
VLDGFRPAEAPRDLVARFVAPLAGLLFLRWAAFMEAEAEAISAFNDTPFSPGLPEALRQASWNLGHGLATRLYGGVLGGGLRRGLTPNKYVVAAAPIVQEGAERHEEAFASLVEWVARLRFESADEREAAAVAFDDVLARVVEGQGKHGGEFTTPQQVVDLMVELVDPKPGDRVYDPCFGVGGLLVEAARRLRRATASEAPRHWSEVRNNGIFGVEINAASFVIGLCRVVLVGIDNPGLEIGDTLERPLPRHRAAEGFDCILAAPPWGSKSPGVSSWQYPVSTRSIENLFLQHVMAHLRPGGRAVIALPERTLFRTGADRQVRRALLQDFRVDGVISLPTGAFAPSTSIPSSLVVFRRDKPRADVRFVQIPPKSWDTATGGSNLGDGQGSRTGPVALLREVSDVVSRNKELRADDLGLGIDAWAVPVGTLAARDFELLAKRAGTEQLEATLERLSAADSDLRLASLDQVAEVFQGVSYDRKLTTERRQANVLAPLVRVGDVSEHRVRPPTLFFTDNAEQRIRDEQRLRPGDMLITISGTVGKIGMVEEGREVVGALATKSLVVIRPSMGLTAAFLAALLRSPAYQEWFAGHARGSTIQHVSVRTLRKLPVPVPPVPVQDAVVRKLSSGGDAMGLLLRLATGGTSDPITAWLERPPVVAAMAEERLSTDAARMLSSVAHELEQLRSLRNRVVHDKTTDASRALATWLSIAPEIGEILARVDSIPEGTPRLAVLELARGRIANAERALAEVGRTLDRGGDALAHRVLFFTHVLEELVDRAAGAMLESVKLQLRPSPSEVRVGVPTGVELRLTNLSRGALRNLQVATTPDVGKGTIEYLAEGSDASVPLTVQALDAGEAFKFTVRWSGVRLDGRTDQDEETLELHVKSAREDVLAGGLGPSPYIVGNPVDREEMFYGRHDVLAEIRRQLGSTTHANVVLLEGNRRTGKTSILRQLQKKDALPGWVAVLCDFQGGEGDESRPGISTRNVYRLLAKVVGMDLFEAGVRTWFPGEPEARSSRPFKDEFRETLSRAFASEHPFEVFEQYLSAALAAARPRRVVLMLDEFDKLQEGIDSGVTSPQVPENIRHLLQHHAGLSAILTGSRRLKRLREEYWSVLFGIGHRIGISGLPFEDARRLVTEPVKGRLSYLATARDLIVELCAGQPFLIQSLCNWVFDRAAVSGERTITPDAVNNAADEMVRDNEHFRTLWDYAETHRRRLVLTLCKRLEEEPDPVTLELLFAKLEALRVYVARESQVGDDLKSLQELELVEFDKSYRGGTYRITVPLLGLWIQRSIDFEDAAARAREEAQEAQP